MISEADHVHNCGVEAVKFGAVAGWSATCR
jgi:hypothetical protein